MSAILLIVIGIVVGGWAAKANTVIESQRPIILQGPLGGLIQLVCQFGGLGLLVYGVVKLFREPNMEIVIGIIVVFVALIIIGKIKGAPDPTSMSIEALLGRMQSEGAWIQRYKSLPYENQQGAGIKKQYEDKKLYVMQLQLELMKRSTDKDQETLIPVLQRAIELMRNGMGEEEAQAQATNEYVQKRDAKASQPPGGTS